MANKSTYTYRPQPPQGEHSDLNYVLTVAEVAAGWGKHEKTVKLAINTGRLTARRAGSVWLISYKSARRLWGKPVEAAQPYPF